jgi:hypothetical protein
MNSERSILKKNGKQEPEDSTPHANKLSNKSWFDKWRKKWSDMTPANKLMVSFTGVIAFCTVVNAGVAYVQWRGLLDSNRINRDALESVQRAFVSFSPKAGIGTLIEHNQVVSWWPQIPMTNGGNTSTKKMFQSSGIFFSVDEIPDTFGFPYDTPPVKGRLGPKDIADLDTKGIPLEQVQAVQAHKGHLYVYGEARYDDVFHKSHVTEFCYELHTNSITGDLASPSYSLMGRFDTCHRHNCDDEDCEEKK